MSHEKTFLAELKFCVCVTYIDLNRNTVSYFLLYIEQIKCNNRMVFRPIWIPLAIEEEKIECDCLVCN